MDSKSSVSVRCFPAETGGRPAHSPSVQNSSVITSPAVPSGLMPLGPESISTPQSKRTTQEIVPMDLHHPILREFPEHREIIRRLKGSNEHFRSLFDEYHRLDDEVYRIEEDIDFATDQEIEELKMRRAKLKDYIYHIIRHAPPPCPVCEGSGLAQ
jgi:uncharacterized protein YdcH (DUF465 family)